MDETDWALLEALFADARSPNDSGIDAGNTRERIKQALLAIPLADRRDEIAGHLREWYLTDEARCSQYGSPDARDFLDWLEHDLGVPL